MFNDGKSKAGAAGFSGMAFIHPVKPFEDAFLFLLRHADARIPNGPADSIALL